MLPVLDSCVMRRAEVDASVGVRLKRKGLVSG